MPSPTSPKAAPDDRRLAAVDVEDLGREQPADAEHRDERQQQRHQRHAADVEVEDGAEDVVDQHRDQQQAAADEGADDEDEVLDRDVDHRGLAPLRDRPRTRRERQDSGRERRDEGRTRAAVRAVSRAGPNRSVSQRSSGLTRGARAPTPQRGRTRRVVGAAAGRPRRA